MLTEAACFALFDELPDVVFFCKDAQGRYTHANRTLLSRLGLRNLAALRGKTAAQVFPAQLGHNYLQQDMRVLQTGRSVPNELELHLFPNRQPGWCLTVKHAIAQGAAVSGIVGISRDLRSPSPQNPVFQRLARTLAVARQRCTDPLSVRELAHHAGLSVAQLERHWLALLQLTPGRWLLSLRLDAAIEALSGTDTVAQVAAQCGFADHSAFARAFRRHVGVSPTQYRQMCAATQPSGLLPTA
ncbi:MAG: helix-turn-helix domain-containing protein [Burkholderiaceae bacterium]